MTDSTSTSTVAPHPKEASLRPFFTLWSGQALSLLGTHAVQFALVWWLTAETGSATVLATATLLALLPMAALGPIIGPLVDRWSRRRVMLAADSIAAAGAALLALLFLTGEADTPHVLSLIFIRALAGAFHAPAMIASTSLMVPERHLARIQGLNQALQGGAAIVAAPLGALLVEALPMALVMAIDVVTALFGVVPLLFVPIPSPHGSMSGAAAEQPSVVRGMLDGFRYLMQRGGHASLLMMAAIINLFLVPAFSLLPLLVRDQMGGDALHLGWMTSASGIGMFAGGVTLGAWGGFRPRILTSLAGIAGLGLAVTFLGVTPATRWSAANGALLMIGFTAAMANGPILAVLQATVPPEYQGRIFTLYGSLASITTPIGLLLAAPLAEMFGVRTWYLAGGLVCLVMGAGAFFVPAIVRIESAAAGPSTDTPADQRTPGGSQRSPATATD
ncbi:MAG TPA: MFS transporter [Candidatus Polarisedimenticolia bacterium]|nr:MFS transporter [Candidatus Polarisedimenticolia bacterium]